MEDLTGRQLGRYQIIVPLGEGGMAAVYKAYQLGKINRYVALKVLPQQLAERPDFVGRFNQEANVLAGLQHPRILPVFDFGEAEGYTYIVMPFVDSGTLAGLLHGQPLPLPQVRSFTVQVAEALDYAHARGLVHRDVKPSNVLVDERGNCLLSDFGISKILESTARFTTTGGVIGTPEYMSPEQGRGETLDARSDIYSLGVMLFEMVTGRVPFKAETPVAVIFKHIQDPLPPPRSINPNLPEAVEQVLFKALAKRREDRYQTAGEMAQAIRAAIPESTAPPYPLHVAETVPKDRATELGTAQVRGRATLPAPMPAQPKTGLPTWILAIGGLALVSAGVVACIAAIALAPTIGRLLSPGATASPVQPATQPPSSTPVETQIPATLPATVAPPPPTPSPTPIRPRIYGFSACLEQCNGTNGTRQFPEAVTKIYAQWSYEGIPTGASYVRAWTLNGREWVKYVCTWPGPASGVDNVSLTEPDGLHFGAWELTIAVNNEILLREQITVSGTWDYWFPAGTFDTCYGKK